MPRFPFCYRSPSSSALCFPPGDSPNPFGRTTASPSPMQAPVNNASLGFTYSTSSVCPALPSASAPASTTTANPACSSPTRAPPTPSPPFSVRSSGGASFATSSSTSAWLVTPPPIARAAPMDITPFQRGTVQRGSVRPARGCVLITAISVPVLLSVNYAYQDTISTHKPKPARYNVDITVPHVSIAQPVRNANTDSS